MYIRFVLKRLNESSGLRDGFFSAAYALSRDAGLDEHHVTALHEALDWFELNLEEPNRLNRTKSKGFYRRATKGVSWFKPTAEKHIRRARELARLLEEHGFHVEVLKTDQPGYVVYEDENQVVAEPFRSTVC